MHDLEGLPRVLLPDRHENEVVEGPLGRKRHVDDLGKVHFENRQEDPDARPAHVEVLHRGNTNDGAGIDRILAAGDRRDMEDGIIVHRRVEPSVVAEGTLGTRLPGLDITLDHKVALRRHLERLGHALY